MQNAELYRRGFVVPLNEEAEISLRSNAVNENTLVEFFKIPNEEVFEMLWQRGLFKKINDSLGSMIDDYEEEIIEGANLLIVKKIVAKFKNSHGLGLNEINVVSELERLCQISINKQTGLFFIF